MKLSKGKNGTVYIIEKILCSRKNRSFLLTLGCYKGASVNYLYKVNNNILMKIADSKYAISSRICDEIIVKEK